MSVAAQETTERHVSFERERGVYQIQVTRDVAHVVVEVGADAERPRRLMRVFRALAERSIPIFLIKLHHSAVSFAVEGVRVPDVERSLQGVALECAARRDLALLSIIASSMRDLTGVMVSIADALQETGARLYGVGDSHNSVQCLIEEARVEPALTQLRLVFGLEDEG